MAGQFTFTHGPVFQGEALWIIRAMMSLPVPLSPLIRTGTLAAAILASRSRRARMPSLAPKTTGSGGISPRGWISELTGFEVLIIVPASVPRGLLSSVHPENQTLGDRHLCDEANLSP